MPEQPPQFAPEYRYFVADLLTNQVLTELPFSDVNYTSALNGAGKFQGKIPVLAATEHLDLDDSTMPTQTALYVVRNGLCVWGGIIWSRTYSATSKTLVVNASEFPSYFHHRRIWKTWTHDLGATVFYDVLKDTWRVQFDYNTSAVVTPGSTVRLLFDPLDTSKFDGYYRVRDAPAPTKSGFAIEAGFAIADISQGERKNGLVTLYTQENHGYATGDVVTFNFQDPDYTEYNKNIKVIVPPLTSGNVLQFEAPGVNIKSRPLGGTARKPLTRARYENVTVQIRSDAFDYVRSLIGAVARDFVGTDFPNAVIEPGISEDLAVIKKRADFGAAVLTTAKPHGLAVGQAVQLENIDSSIDGEWEVQNVSSDTTFAILNPATIPQTNMAEKSTEITSLELASGRATYGTSSPHGFKIGEKVLVDPGPSYPLMYGVFPIRYTPTPTTFVVDFVGSEAIEHTDLTPATLSTGGTDYIVDAAGITGSTATLVLRDTPEFDIGDTVITTHVDRHVPIKEKALNASTGVATIQTTQPHGYTVGQQIYVSGLTDNFTVIEKALTPSTVSLRMDTVHSFKAGQIVTVSGMEDFTVTHVSIASNTITLTSPAHDIAVGASVTVTSIRDVKPILSSGIYNNVGSLRFSAPHNYKVNDPIVVAGLPDTYTIEARAVIDGMVVITTNRPHNVLEGDKIKIAGLGAPYDGDQTVSKITSERIFFKLDAKWQKDNKPDARVGSNGFVDVNIPEAWVTGSVYVEAGFLNGEFTISAVTSQGISFVRVGNNYGTTVAPSTATVDGPSTANGTYTVSARTTDTLSYAKTANSYGTVKLVQPENTSIPVPAASIVSRHSGPRTITNVTSNTIQFAQANPVSSFKVDMHLSVARPSIFNGNRTIAAVWALDKFEFNLPGIPRSVVESTSSTPGHVSATNIYNGTFVVTDVDKVTNEVSFVRNLPTFARQEIQSVGAATVAPIAIVSTFGPFPGNGDIGIEFESRNFAGINLEPITYRGFELKTVGDALDDYADSIDGFEYRIDSIFDPTTETFRRVFKLLPIRLPNPPVDGEPSPLSRFGADKLVFEHPGGSVSELVVEENGDTSATRFFVSGTTDLGPDAGPPIGVASSTSHLRGGRGRKWPLIDSSDTASDVEEEYTLYTTAARYLSEAQPPKSDLKLTVNGSVSPIIGSYAPGDWCSVVTHDKFIQTRLQNGTEPRRDVLVRKISSIAVRVPDGVSAPEVAQLTLVPEWEVDSLGK